MKIVRFSEVPRVPASHENPADPGVWKRVLFAREALPEGRAQMVNWAELPAGSEFCPHYHEDMDELFVVIRGTVEMRVDNARVALGPGDAICVASREVHSMRNDTGETAEYVVIGLSRDQGGKTIRVYV